MKKPPYFNKMASGDLSIVLGDGVGYWNFPRYARRWSRRLRLKVLHKIDGPGERIWECERDTYKFWLSWDDWFPTISLEPQDHDAGGQIASIAAEIGLTAEADKDG